MDILERQLKIVKLGKKIDSKQYYLITEKGKKLQKEIKKAKLKSKQKILVKT